MVTSRERHAEEVTRPVPLVFPSQIFEQSRTFHASRLEREKEKERERIRRKASSTGGVPIEVPYALGNKEVGWSTHPLSLGRPFPFPLFFVPFISPIWRLVRTHLAYPSTVIRQATGERDKMISAKAPMFVRMSQVRGTRICAGTCEEKLRPSTKDNDSSTHARCWNRRSAYSAFKGVACQRAAELVEPLPLIPARLHLQPPMKARWRSALANGGGRGGLLGRAACMGCAPRMS